MDVVKEIMAAIKQYETIIIHEHQRPIQMQLAHGLG